MSNTEWPVSNDVAPRDCCALNPRVARGDSIGHWKFLVDYWRFVIGHSVLTIGRYLSFRQFRLAGIFSIK